MGQREREKARRFSRVDERVAALIRLSPLCRQIDIAATYPVNKAIRDSFSILYRARPVNLIRACSTTADCESNLAAVRN